MVNNLNWMDILTVLVLVFYAVNGLLKGLIVSVFRIAGFFISLYAARLLAPIISGLITGNTGIYSGLYDYFGTKIPNDPTLATAFNIIGANKSDINGSLTSLFITIASFILAFLVIKLILLLVERVLNMTSRLPVINQFNKAGGFIFGIVKGIIILYIVFAVLVLLTPVLEPDNVIIQTVNSSILAVNFYKYNFIIQWISSFSL